MYSIIDSSLPSCLNGDLRLTFGSFTAMSNLRPHAFVREKMLKSHFLRMYERLMAETYNK